MRPSRRASRSRPRRRRAPDRILRGSQAGQQAGERVTLDAPLLTALVAGTREKRRRVALDAIPARMQEAVLAIEDRRFYYHPGIDPHPHRRRAVITNVFGNAPYPVGAQHASPSSWRATSS